MQRITITLRGYSANKKGLSPLYLQVFIQKKKLEMPINLKVPGYTWDKNQQVVLPNHPQSSDYNLIINQAKALANDIFIRYRLQNREITVDRFRDEFRNPNKYIDFYKFMANEIEQRRGTISEGTINHHFSVLEKLKVYKQECCFSEIDVQFIEKFDRHMQRILKNGINTRHASMKVFKTYLNIALNRELISANPFQKVKVKKAKTHRTALTEEELSKMVEYYREMPLCTKKLVLRHFLFCCFTGLRVSDLIALQHEHIYDSMIHLTPKKTSNVNAQEITIPLSRSALELIKDENRFRVKGPVFECISEQKMRDNINKVAADLKIEKHLGTHSGRHTFATFFLKKTKDLATLQKLLGHSSINQTMIYVDVLEEDLKEGVKVFDVFSMNKKKEPAPPDPLSNATPLPKE